MLTAKLRKPLHVTSMHIKFVKGMFDSRSCQRIKLFLRAIREQFILTPHFKIVETCFSNVSASEIVNSVIKNCFLLLFSKQNSIDNYIKKRALKKIAKKVIEVNASFFCHLDITLIQSGP